LIVVSVLLDDRIAAVALWWACAGDGVLDPLRPIIS
jgi:hypothetical protein